LISLFFAHQLVIISAMTANQSRRRVTENADNPEPVERIEKFQYQELRGDVDSIRLLTIEPADNPDDAIVCRMDVVEFGERPRYEALSYMWGSDENQSSIIVNGCSISVRQNLWEALRYLRPAANKLRIWIDALCINQEDIPERNRQLRIMHHIYFRASLVVVWLGAGYVAFKDLVPRLRARIKATEPTTSEKDTKLSAEEDKQTIGNTGEKGLIEALSKNGYWQRLWIIQEVAQAERLVVCFGSFQPMSWGEFIHLMRMHNCGENGPQRLDQLRRNADAGALTFERLLYDHREAICTERRDKIYGLVGLADDAHGFPMDYTKPLIEVWKDVMHFVNERRLVPDTKLMQFGAMVKSLIIGNDCTPLMQVLRSGSSVTYESESAALDNHRPFNLSGIVLGQIGHIGASTTAIISQLSTVDAWNRKVQENFRSHVEDAQRESRALQRAILRPSTDHNCFNHVPSVRWLEHADSRRSGKRHANTALGRGSAQYKDHMTPIRSEAATTDPSLYQLKTQDHRLQTTFWKMGIASYQAEEGDLIVWLHDRRRAMVIRCCWDQNNPGWVYSKIVGTAWVTADLSPEPEEHSNRVNCFSEWDTMPIQMDADTMFVMLS
jgi:hypothetical protein